MMSTETRSNPFPVSPSYEAPPTYPADSPQPSLLVAQEAIKNTHSSPVISIGETRLKHLQDIISSDEMKIEFDGFLNSVFLQVDPRRFYQILSEILKQNLSYEETYKALLRKIGEAKENGFANLLTKIKSLRILTETLSDQTARLLGKGGTVDGYVEYGYNGRLIRPLQKHAGIHFTGRLSVVSDGEKKTDVIERGFPKPYHQFIPLNDYHPLTLPKSSVELILLPIGLHHIPSVDKIHALVQSMADVLKPGGSLILRDHDVVDERSETIAEVAHIVFNAATGESLEEEMQARQFRPMQEWTDILADHGFKREEGACVSDTSRNTLVRFIKDSLKPEDDLQTLETIMRNRVAGYERPAQQTYLTTLEWHLVHTAEEFAHFVKEHPIHQFPFFQHISILWKLFIDSCREATRICSFKAIALSEYMLMNYFMVFFTSAELLFKGLAYAPLRILPWTSESHKSDAHKKSAQISKEYAEFLPHTPSYQFPQMSLIKGVWQTFKDRKNGSTFINLYITAMTIAELFAKAIILWPIDKAFRGVAPGHIHLIIDHTSILPSNVTEIETKGNYTAIKMERYQPFVETLKTLASQGVNIHSIAGQRKIQVKVKVGASASDPTQGLQGVRQMLETPIPTEKNYAYKRLEVDVNQLSPVLEALKAKGTEITYIHDF